MKRLLPDKKFISFAKLSIISQLVPSFPLYYNAPHFSSSKQELFRLKSKGSFNISEISGIPNSEGGIYDDEYRIGTAAANKRTKSVSLTIDEVTYSGDADGEVKKVAGECNISPAIFA